MKIRIPKSRSEMSLTALLAIAFFALSAIVLVISGGLQIAYNYQTQRDVVFSQQRLIAQEAASAVSNFIEDKFGVLETAVKLENIVVVPAEEQERILGNALGFQPAFRQLALFDAEGQLLTQSSRLVQARSQEFVNQVSAQAFTNIEQTDRYTSPIIIDNESSEPLIIIAVPVFDLLGDFQGMLAAELNLKFMWDLVDQLEVGETGYAYVVDKQGDLVAYADTARVLKRENVSQLQEVEHFLEGELEPEHGADLAPGLEGETTIQAFVALGSPDWAVITEIPVAEAFAPVTRSAIGSGIVLLLVALASGAAGIVVARRLAQPLLALTKAAVQIAEGNVNLEAKVAGNLEVSQLATAFNNMTARLRNFIGSLEERVAERTRDLELAAEVGRRVSEVKDITILLQEAADLIRHRFNLYHVQIYMVDEEQELLVLRASTGEAGEQLLAGGHRLPLDASSLNGRAAQEKETVLVADTAADPMFKPNRLLPDTVAEAAIPLLLGNRVVGVLDLQSADFESLNVESLPAFETLAGQLAVAIDNATLFAERQQAAEALIPFRLGFERSPGAIFMTDVDGVINYVNPAFTKLYNYSAAEALGRTPQILQSGLIPQDKDEHFWQMLFNGQAIAIADELVSKTKNGRFVYVSANQSPVTNDNGEIIGFLALHTDISERKMAEERLDRRVAELNCLNEIGRKVEESLPIPEFMEWVTTRIKPVFKHTDSFMAAIMIGEIVYGVADAISQKRHIVEGLYIGNELIGNLYFSYADETLAFGDEDSSFIGAVGGRVSSYVESRRLLEQLEHQATDLQQVAEIGTAVATILNPHELMQTFVDLTKSKFGLYHTHIYLFDVGTEILRLTSGAGDIGRMMVAERREIPLHKKQSLVALAARSRQGVIVNDVQNETGFLPHPLLPDTRAEMAVPLVVFDQLLGVLDVQADTVDAFSQADVSIFTTLATQVAVALQNANQHKETQQTLEEVSALQRAMTREGWHGYLTAKEKPVYGYVADQTYVRPITKSEQSQEANTVLLQKIRGDETAVITPVRLGSAAIGSLGVRTLADNTISDEQQELLQAISEQVGQALERARLFEETEIARTQTEALYVGSNQVVRARTINDVLKALVHSTKLRQLSRAAFILFETPWNEHPPKTAITVAAHENVKIPTQFASDQPLPLDMIPFARFFDRDEPFILEDINSFEQADDQIRDFYEKTLAMRSFMTFPMVVGEDWIGVMVVNHKDPLLLTQEEIRQISSLLDQAATVIQSLRLYAATEARATELAIINNVVSTIAGTLDIQQSLQLVAGELARVTSVGQVSIALINDDQTEMTVVAEYDRFADVQGVTSYEVPIEGNLLTQEVLRTRKTVIVENAQQHPLTEPMREVMAARGVETLYVLPMLVGETVVGTIDLDVLQKGVMLSERQINLAETLVYQAATAVQNASLFTQSEERAKELAFINRIVTEINALDTETGLQFMADELSEILQIPSISIGLIDNTATMLEMVASHHPEGAPSIGRSVIPVARDPIISRALKTRQTVVVEDVANSNLPPQIREAILSFGIRSICVVPMLAGRDLIGTISLNVMEGGNLLTSDQLKLAETTVQQVATAVQNARLFTQSEERAKELAFINRIVTEVNALDTETGLQFMAEELGNVLQVPLINIRLIDDTGTKLKVVAARHPAETPSPVGTVLPVGKNPAGNMLLTKQTVIIEDIANSNLPPQVQKRILAAGIRSLYIIPMMVGRDLIGSVAMNILEGGSLLTPDQLELAETTVQQAATAVQNARLYTETQERAEELSLINRVGEMASSQLNTTELFNSVGMLIKDTFMAANVYFALYDKQKSIISFPYFYSKDRGLLDVEPQVMEDGGFSAKIIETQKSICQLLQQDDPDSEVTVEGARVVNAGDRLADSFVGVPMIVGRDVVGVIGLSNYSDIRTYTEQDQRLLESLAGTIGVAVQNSQQFEVAQRRAERESLINMISQKIQSATTVESALQTAVSELGQALKLKKAVVELSTSKQSNGQS